jgi:hypothetical protein
VEVVFCHCDPSSHSRRTKYNMTQKKRKSESEDAVPCLEIGGRTADSEVLISLSVESDCYYNGDI